MKSVIRFLCVSALMPSRTETPPFYCICRRAAEKTRQDACKLLRGADVNPVIRLGDGLNDRRGEMPAHDKEISLCDI